MEEEQIAVTLGRMDERVKSLQANMEDAVSRIEKCIEAMGKNYDDAFKSVNCRIEDRIKISDSNQSRLEKRIVKLEKSLAVITATATMLSIIIQEVLSHINI